MTTANNNDNSPKKRERTAKKATIEDFKIKCMIWGATGSGKSRFALSSPKPLVVDLENSTGAYANEFDFYVARINPAKQHINCPSNLLRTIIDDIHLGLYGNEVETLVIDPISDLLDDIEYKLSNSYETKVIKKKITDLNALDKAKWYAYRRDRTRAVLDEMMNIDLNLIWVAREKNVWEKVDGFMRPVDKTYDGLEIIESLPDVVINIKKDVDSVVKKSRIGELKSSMKIKTWDDIIKGLEKSSITPTAEKA